MLLDLGGYGDGQGVTMFTILHAFQNKIFQLFSQLDITKASDFFATFPKKTLRPRFLISLHRNKISQRNRRKGFFIFSSFFLSFQAR